MIAVFNDSIVRVCKESVSFMIFAAAIALAGCMPVQPVIGDESALVDDDEAMTADAPAATVGSIESALLANLQAGREVKPRQAQPLANRLQQNEPQGVAAEPSTSNPFLLLFPELRTAPAPRWLRAGTRVTYYVQNANFILNPDDPDPSGAGYLQYDLVALDRISAVSSMKFYVVDVLSGVVTPSTVVPSYGAPGVGDFWISPVVLAHAEDAANPDLVVVRMPTTVGDQEYNAVRFQYQDDNAEYVWMFDEISGLLLFHRYAIGDPLYEDAQSGQMALMQQRRLRIPWRRGAIPDWVQVGTDLGYEGYYGTEIHGAPRLDMPYGLTAQIKRAQRRWSEYEATDYLYGRVNTRGPRVLGTAQLFDALWLPINAAARIRNGQVLDTDPVTGARVVVEHKDAGSVVLAEVGDTYRTALTYDAIDGKLLAISSQTQAGVAKILIDLQLVP